MHKQGPPTRGTERGAKRSGAPRKVAAGWKRTSNPGAYWTFMSNHLYVLACLAHDSRLRLRDVAFMVGITERAVQKIVADLEAAGILKRFREGRRNHYKLFREVPLRHPLGAHRTVGALLDLILGSGSKPFRTPGEQANR